MSQSLLYHAFGVREGYDYQETVYQDGCIRFVLSVRSDWIKCPGCGSQEINRKGRRFRELQTVPIGLKPVFLVTEVPKCQSHVEAIKRKLPHSVLFRHPKHRNSFKEKLANFWRCVHSDLLTNLGSLEWSPTPCLVPCCIGSRT